MTRAGTHSISLHINFKLYVIVSFVVRSLQLTSFLYLTSKHCVIGVGVSVSVGVVDAHCCEIM